MEMAGGAGDAEKLFEAWRELKQTKLYYRPVGKGKERADRGESKSADKENISDVSLISRKGTNKKLLRKPSSNSFLSTNYLNFN